MEPEGLGEPAVRGAVKPDLAAAPGRPLLSPNLRKDLRQRGVQQHRASILSPRDLQGPLHRWLVPAEDVPPRSPPGSWGLDTLLSRKQASRAWAPGERQLKPAAAGMGSCVPERRAQGGRRLGPESYSSGASEVTGRRRLTHGLTSDVATATTNLLGDQPKCRDNAGCTGAGAGPRAPHGKDARVTRTVGRCS